MPQIFGFEHLTFLAVMIILGVVSTIFATKYLTNEKSKAVYIKILAGIVLANVMLCRIAMTKLYEAIYIIPTSLCSLTAVVFSLLVIFGKPNMKVYHCFWYMAMVGGLVTVIYPDFISSMPSVFCLNNFTSFVYHAVMVILCVTMYLFGWFRIEFNKCYYFPMIFCLYIVIGSFEWHYLNLQEAMDLTKPLISGTPLNAWFVWVVGSALVAIVSLLVEYLRKYLKNKEIETKANKEINKELQENKQ